tara:strand:- start:2588 stop:3700 length:1113 start_codon:yes stop_codon:yes gene_type:complete
MKSITYIFSGGRKSNFESQKYLAREFYYGITDISDSKHIINIIEFENSKTKFSRYLNFQDRIFSKILSLPLSFSKVVSVKNFKILLKTDELILVNEGVALSVLPLLIILKCFHKIKVSVFVMGLYSKKINYNFVKFLHNFIIRILVFFTDNIFFLGFGELEIAKNFHSNSRKLIYFPFSVDTDFWTRDVKLNLKDNNKILFVGNDGNRDVELLKQIASNMKDFKFIVVSKLPEFQNVNLENITVFNGSWGDSNIDDIKLREIYSEAFLVVIPLKESSQPSGQSVALQAMSMGIPVLVSQTQGLWDKNHLINGENIFLIQPNTLSEWVNKIKVLKNNKTLLNTVSKNAEKTVRTHFNLSKFQNQLNQYIGE